MSRALKITFVVSIALVVVIAIVRGVRAEEPLTPGETVCVQRSAVDLVLVMRLQNTVAALQAQIEKRKQEDNAAAKEKVAP